jgi:hypothetical protein
VYPPTEQQWLALQWRQLQSDSRLTREDSRLTERSASDAGGGGGGGGGGAGTPSPGPGSGGDGAGYFGGGAVRAAAVWRAGVAAVKARIVATDSLSGAQARPSAARVLRLMLMTRLRKQCCVRQHFCNLGADAYKSSSVRHRHSDEPRQLSDPRLALTECNARVQAAVDLHEVQTYIEWHRRVIGRALELLAPAAAAKDIAAFFHKKVAHLPPACLLDQVVSHCLAGVAAASRRTAAGLKQPMQVRRAAGGCTAHCRLAWTPRMRNH